jgi:hypothetical protein
MMTTMLTMSPIFAFPGRLWNMLPTFPWAGVLVGWGSVADDWCVYVTGVLFIPVGTLHCEDPALVCVVDCA